MSQDRAIVAKILSGIAKLNSLDKKRIITHEGEKLHPSEIQLLMHLFHEQNTNVIAIAKSMGLTKGAISQTLSRLQKKGIISKEMHPGHELRIKFTEEGNQLMLLLNKSKKSLERKYLRYIKSLSESNKQVVSEFLDKMLSIMEKH